MHPRCPDTYWALCAERPYRPALSSIETIAMIEGQAGQQFDAAVVEVLPQAMAAVARQVPASARTTRLGPVALLAMR